MPIEPTELAGVYLIKYPKFDDDRGFFREVFRHSDISKTAGVDFRPVQANHSHSSRGTLRGIHIAPWDKLVTVVNGEVQQVVVDARKDSPTFGRYVSLILGAADPAALFVPAGCGNAFLTVSEAADYLYLVTQEWSPNQEISVRWDDPDLNIKWQLGQLTLSERDQGSKAWRDL